MHDGHSTIRRFGTSRAAILRTAILATLTLAVALGLIPSGWAAPPGASGPEKMRVEFLYSIEGVGGRGDRLRSPRDIAYDRKADELYIADPGRRGVLIFDRNGMFTQQLAVDEELGSPMIVATDGEGRIYVGYNRSAKISVLDFRGELMDSFEIPGVVDMPGVTVRPQYLASGPDGHVYALKNKGGMVRIDPFGEKHEEIVLGGNDAPAMIYGFALDAKGRFLFSDMRPASVVVYDPEAESFQRMGSQGVIYGQLARPQGVATDDAGHIFVTSLVRHNVLCYDENGDFIEEFGGIGKQYGRFYMPSKLVHDGRDKLYVLEPALKRIQVFRIVFPQEETNTNPPAAEVSAASTGDHPLNSSSL